MQTLCSPLDFLYSRSLSFSPELVALIHELKDVKTGWPMHFFICYFYGTTAKILQGPAHPLIRMIRREKSLPMHGHYGALGFSVVIDKFENIFQLLTADYPPFNGEDAAEFFKVVRHCVGYLDGVFPIKLILV